MTTVDLSLVRHRAVLLARMISDTLSRDISRHDLHQDCLAAIKHHWELVEAREPARVPMPRQVELLRESAGLAFDFFLKRGDPSIDD